MATTGGFDDDEEENAGGEEGEVRGSIPKRNIGGSNSNSAAKAVTALDNHDDSDKKLKKQILELLLSHQPKFKDLPALLNSVLGFDAYEFFLRDKTVLEMCERYCEKFS